MREVRRLFAHIIYLDEINDIPPVEPVDEVSHRARQHQAERQGHEKRLVHGLGKKMDDDNERRDVYAQIDPGRGAGQLVREQPEHQPGILDIVNVEVPLDDRDRVIDMHVGMDDQLAELVRKHHQRRDQNNHPVFST